jgi:hypothetical protein
MFCSSFGLLLWRFVAPGVNNALDISMDGLIL